MTVRKRGGSIEVAGREIEAARKHVLSSEDSDE